MTRRRGWFALLAGLFGMLVATTSIAAPLRVLLVGNSLSYTNNLAGLLAAMSQAEARPLDVELVATAGGSIADRWRDGFVQRLLDEQHWDVLILQERGGRIACLDEPLAASGDRCRELRRAHEGYARLAQDKGTRVLLLGTWADTDAWQQHLSAGLRHLAKALGASAVDPAPALHTLAAQRPPGSVFVDEQMHPSLDASLLIAVTLYRKIYGRAPTRGFDAPLPLLGADARLRAWRTLRQQRSELPEAEPLHVASETISEFVEVATRRHANPIAVRTPH